MNYNKQNIVILGTSLIKTLKYIKYRIHIKSKTNIFKIAARDSDCYDIEELIFECAAKLLYMPKKSYDTKTDKKEVIVKRECYQYLQAVQSLPQEMKQNLKVSKLEQYLKNDFSNILYKQNFLKEIVMDEVEEKKSLLLTRIIEELEWNNSVLQK